MHANYHDIRVCSRSGWCFRNCDDLGLLISRLQNNDCSIAPPDKTVATETELPPLDQEKVPGPEFKTEQEVPSENIAAEDVHIKPEAEASGALANGVGSPVSCFMSSFTSMSQ